MCNRAKQLRILRERRAQTLCTKGEGCGEGFSTPSQWRNYQVALKAISKEIIQLFFVKTIYEDNTEK